MKTLKIGRREFTVEVDPNVDGVGPSGPVYILTGVRGAKYATMRNVHRPHLMFLVTARGFGMAKGYESVWLTDKNGELEVAR